LSPHYDLSEFLPRGWDGSVPPEVLGNLITLSETVLEPMRVYLGRPIRISSGWRPEEYNAAIGGELTSDHPGGRAADLWGEAHGPETWQLTTIRLFHWARIHLVGKFGQLILEDHRDFKKRETALWLHVSIPTRKHPGHGDPSAVLVSPQPHVYERFQEPSA
jgi:hypothetical protein